MAASEHQYGARRIPGLGLLPCLHGTHFRARISEPTLSYELQADPMGDEKAKAIPKAYRRLTSLAGIEFNRLGWHHKTLTDS
jgi:hypothetical protein